MVQLFGPLGRLGMFYAQINQSFIDMENMFQLFKEVQTVQDEPYCPNLQIITVRKYRVVKKKVSFGIFGIIKTTYDIYIYSNN